MNIEFDLEIEECNYVNAKCEKCNEKERNLLRKIIVKIRCNFFAEIILCTKCLTSKIFWIRK